MTARVRFLPYSFGPARFPIRAILCALLLLGGGDLRARTLELELGQKKYPVGLFLEILEDPGGKLDFQTVRGDALPGWTPSREEIPNFTFSTSVYWLRLRLKNPGAGDRKLLLELASARHDYIDAYIELDPGEFEITRTGDRRPFHTRKHHHRHFLFDIPLPAGQLRSVYFRLESHDGLHEAIPLVLWEPDAFARNDSLRHHVLGILLGVLLIMAIYNLFITVSLLDPSYFYYVLLVLALVVWFFSHHGFAAMLIWPGAHDWGNQIIPFALSLALLMSVFFTRSFLRSGPGGGRFDRTLKIAAALVLANLALIPFDFYSFAHLVFYGLGLLVFGLIALACLSALRAGFGPARFILIALACLLLGGAFSLLRDEGVFAHNLLSENALALGLFSGVVVLSLGLADRINLIRREKEAAQRETLLFQNELELARHIQESLLPHAPPRLPGLRVAMRYQPMENVGGDFYDFHVKDGKLAALIADVSGHGVPAALIVSIVKIAFAQQSDRIAEPVQLFRGMNDILHGHVGNEFVSAGYACIDPAGRKLIAGTAGHPPLLVRKHASGDILAVRPFGQLLGLFPEPRWQPQTVDLHPGDRILLFTDGVYEAENEEREQFGLERTRQFLQDGAGHGGEEFLERFLARLSEWTGGPEKVYDDIALVCIDVLEN